VPGGHGDSKANGVEPVECRVGVSGGELLDCVIDAGHGFEANGEPLGSLREQ
jgi:hypothetical protein